MIPKDGISSELEKAISDALNEQGYLFQHKVVSVLRESTLTQALDWRIEAVEMPVSLPDGQDTRIDIVLRSMKRGNKNFRVAVECKRSAKDFKAWVFFGETQISRPSPNAYYIESAEMSGAWDHSGEPPMMHGTVQSRAKVECLVYEYAVEARVKQKGHESKSSSTQAIEDALRQVTLGQVGLALKLRKAQELRFRLLPVIVTTAELFSAEFSTNKVDLERGNLSQDDFSLESRRWLAVNYRISDIIANQSGFTTARNSDIAIDMESRNVRTVFVVSAVHIEAFLTWLHHNL